MSNLTFMSSPKTLFTSESVTEGHPDKLCDQISDAILDAIMAQDPNGRVACEAAATTGLVLVLGDAVEDRRAGVVPPLLSGFFLGRLLLILAAEGEEGNGDDDELLQHAVS